MCTFCHPINLFLAIYTIEIPTQAAKCIYKDFNYTFMYNKNWKEPNYPSIRGWLNKLTVYSCNGIVHSHNQQCLSTSKWNRGKASFSRVKIGGVFIKLFLLHMKEVQR